MAERFTVARTTHAVANAQPMRVVATAAARRVVDQHLNGTVSPSNVDMLARPAVSNADYRERDRNGEMPRLPPRLLYSVRRMPRRDVHLRIRVTVATVSISRQRRATDSVSIYQTGATASATASTTSSAALKRSSCESIRTWKPWATQHRYEQLDARLAKGSVASSEEHAGHSHPRRTLGRSCARLRKPCDAIIICCSCLLLYLFVSRQLLAIACRPAPQRDLCSIGRRRVPTSTNCRRGEAMARGSPSRRSAQSVPRPSNTSWTS